MIRLAEHTLKRALLGKGLCPLFFKLPQGKADVGRLPPARFVRPMPERMFWISRVANSFYLFGFNVLFEM